MDDAREVNSPEGVERVQQDPRRVDDQKPPALFDPGPPEGLRRLRLELLVVAVRGRFPCGERGACSERGVDVGGQLERRVSLDQASHQQATVSKDRGPQQLGRHVARGDLHRSTSVGQGVEVGTGELRVLRRPVEQLDPRLVPKPEDAAIHIQVAVGAGGVGDLGQQLIERWQLLGEGRDHRRSVADFVLLRLRLWLTHRLTTTTALPRAKDQRSTLPAGAARMGVNGSIGSPEREVSAGGPADRVESR